MKNGFHSKTISLLFCIGLLGLFGCEILEKFLSGTDNADPPIFLLYLQIIFGIIWCVTLIVITPIQVLYFRRKNRDNDSLQKATIWDFAGLPSHAFNPDAKLPRWISISVLGFLLFLLSIPFLFFGTMAICLLIDHITGQ